METELPDNDKFHEECGVVAVYGHKEAANLAYLGLYALQHRGQESAGITSCDRGQMYREVGMGLVADIFNTKRIKRLPGNMALAHNRYSTAGESKIMNAQPCLINYAKGSLALAHNGNLVNANTIREALVEDPAQRFEVRIDTGLLVEVPERGEPTRHDQRIPGQRARLINGALRRDHPHEVRATPVGAYGKSTTDDFAQCCQVGSNPDAFLYPEIWEVEAPFSVGEAYWAGVTQSITGGGGYSGDVLATTLLVAIQDTSGNELYTKEAGIQVLEYMLQGEFTRLNSEQLFGDSTFVPAAVSRALDPLLVGRPTIPPES